MTHPTGELLAATLEQLRRLAEDGANPTGARRAMAELREAHAHSDIELVWAREPAEETWHYDALIRAAGGTVSLAWCKDSGVPWPLRGVQRWSDADLVRVNTTVVQVGTAVALLDLIWNEQRVLTRIVDTALLEAEVVRRGLDVSDADLQRAMDAFRSRRGLWSAGATELWLKEHGLTQRRLEEILGDQVLREKLVDGLAADELTARLAHARERSERIALVWVSSASRAEAEQWAEDVRAGRCSLLEIAERRFQLDGCGAELRSESPFAIRRWADLAEPLRSALESAAPGAVLGPFAIEGVQRVIQLRGRRAASEEEVREEARRELLEEWLVQQRRSASIEWYWGTDAR